MATRRRGVKHTRRRRGHHAKTKKKLSKRYRGKKGYSKRITRRQTRHSHDPDVINTQSGGLLGPYSEAKTAAGKLFEQVLLVRYFFKRAYEDRFKPPNEQLKGLEGLLKELVDLPSR